MSRGHAAAEQAGAQCFGNGSSAHSESKRKQQTLCTQIQYTLELSVPKQQALRHRRVAENNLHLKWKSLNLEESAEQLGEQGTRGQQREVCAEAETDQKKSYRTFPK